MMSVVFQRLCVALPIGELDMPSLMMHINDPATIKFMAGVSGAPAVTGEVPKPRPPQRSALWEYQDTKIALPDRPSCHDMAATGDCDTNKNYMLPAQKWVKISLCRNLSVTLTLL